MPKKFIQNIQKLIDNTDSKRNLGSISETNISNFKFTPKNLTAVPIEEQETPSSIINDIIWAKRKYSHNRGLSDELTIGNFNTIIHSKAAELTSNNGNFSEFFSDNNVNVSYHAVLVIGETFDAKLEISSSAINSLSIFLRHETKDEATHVYSSGQQPFRDGSVFLPFDQSGIWHIDILYYHETGPSTFSITGNLGSYIESYERPSGIVSLPISPGFSGSFGDIGNRGFESIFIDGANGPTLANIIYWNKFSSSSSAGSDRGGQIMQGYGMYNVVRERLSFDVVSGWGTDAFAVSGVKLDNFPIAGTLGIPGPIAITYQISGTRYDSGADRTIVTLSGTAFTGANSDPIYIERVKHLIDIGHSPTDGEVISGTHFNVKSGDLYTYEIDTFFGRQRGLKSIRISGTAGDINPPGLVTSLAGTGSLKAIRLTWTNPTNIDLKGIHFWDVDTIVSGTTKPIKTIIKGSNTTIPECTVINEVSSGTLIDVWPYKLYASTFDHAGNESTEAMPTVTVTTDVDVITSREGQRIEFDTSTNQLRFYDDNDLLLVTIGDNINGTVGGLGLTNVSAILNKISNPIVDPINVGMTLSDSTGLDSRGAITAEVLFSQSQLTNNKTAGIFGTIADQFHTATSDYIAVRGTSTGTENEHIFAGYFDGAKVFIENDLIVSGNLQLATTSRINIPRADGITIGRILTDTSGDRLVFNLDTGGVRFRSGGNATRMIIQDNGQVNIGSHVPNSQLSVDGIISGTGVLTSTGPNIFNEAGANVDFRIESDVNTDSFFVQGSQGNIGFGTSTFDGTAFGAIAIANGTSPGAGTANQSYIYARDVSSSSEMHVMDEAGNETQISPHNPITGKWEFYSKNKKTGKVLKVNMEKLVKFIDKKFGTDFVEEFYEDV